MPIQLSLQKVRPSMSVAVSSGFPIKGIQLAVLLPHLLPLSISPLFPSTRHLAMIESCAMMFDGGDRRIYKKN